jgi:hypothetical protein
MCSSPSITALASPLLPADVAAAPRIATGTTLMQPRQGATRPDRLAVLLGAWSSSLGEACHLGLGLRHREHMGQLWPSSTMRFPFFQ